MKLILTKEMLKNASDKTKCKLMLGIIKGLIKYQVK
jgi:hypothetical protein